jgi:hypothetical protein
LSKSCRNFDYGRMSLAFFKEGIVFGSAYANAVKI